MTASVAESDVAVVGSVNPSEDEEGKTEVGVSTVGMRLRWVCPPGVRLRWVCLPGG